VRVLSESDWAFWLENGYVIVPDAVPEQSLRRAVDAIWEFQGMDPGDPESWYAPPQGENRMAELNKAGMVELYHHQALWDDRQHPRVHGAFADIWGTEKLWVTIDRANLNVPVRPGWDFAGFIHWDIDTSLDPIPVDVQGVLALEDTPAEQGGFQCVPGFHRILESWIRTQPADRDPTRPDLAGFEVQPVEMRAGDLLIWTSWLPHGTAPNRSRRPRLAQYISMAPAHEHNEALVESRMASWRNRTAPRGIAFPGDPRRLEERLGTTAELTDLGKRLLGLERWGPADPDAEVSPFLEAHLRAGGLCFGRETPEGSEFGRRRDELYLGRGT
jgi:hypothetical protein